MKFIELQNFGWNYLTIIAVMTMLLTVFQAYGISCQSQKIWRTKSGESLSATLFFMYCFYFIAFFFYGLSKNSLAMTFNALLAIPYVPVVVGLIKFKKLTLAEKISLPLSMAIVPLMIITTEKDALLSVLFIISLGILAMQPIEMLKTKTRGAVDIKFIFIFSITSVFWLIYATTIHNPVLTFFNSGALIIYALVIYLYYKPIKK